MTTQDLLDAMATDGFTEWRSKPDGTTSGPACYFLASKSKQDGRIVPFRVGKAIACQSRLWNHVAERRPRQIYSCFLRTKTAEEAKEIETRYQRDFKDVLPGNTNMNKGTRRRRPRK